jgi:hypothetical protein
VDERAVIGGARGRASEGIARRLRDWAENIVALDSRSLAVTRVGLGAILLADLATRAMFLREHYSDAGILPRHLAHELTSPTLGILDAGGGVFLAACVFLAAMAAAVALAIGYRTRWATLACWVLLVSIQNRNPPLFHSGDILLRLALFWGLFLPLGSRWSIDARRGSAGPERIISIGTGCWVIQVMLVFGCLLDHKLSGHSWTHGTAVAEALRVGQYQRELGLWLLSWPSVLRLLTYAVLVAQGLTVLLLGLPFAWARLCAVAMTVATQIGFGLSFRLGHFPWTTSIVMLAFLPPEFWDWLGRRGGFKALAEPEHRSPLAGELGLPGKIVALVALALVCLWNLGEAGATVNVGGEDKPIADTLAGKMALAFRLDQRWAMFAPNPQTEDGWFVMPAVTADGRQVDALRWTLGLAARRSQAGLSLDEPSPTAIALGPHRWAMFLIDLAVEPEQPALEGLSRYACRKWNAGALASDRIEARSLVYLAFEHQADGTVGATVPRQLWKQTCSDEAPPR